MASAQVSGPDPRPLNLLGWQGPVTPCLVLAVVSWSPGIESLSALGPIQGLLGVESRFCPQQDAKWKCHAASGTLRT